MGKASTWTTAGPSKWGPQSSKTLSSRYAITWRNSRPPKLTSCTTICVEATCSSHKLRSENSRGKGAGAKDPSRACRTTHTFSGIFRSRPDVRRRAYQQHLRYRSITQPDSLRYYIDAGMLPTSATDRRGEFALRVFVEQEIALASFMQQVLDSASASGSLYRKRYRSRRGSRAPSFSTLSSFRQDQEILAHLRRILPTWTVPGTPETPMSPLKLDLKIERRASYVAALARSEDKLVVLVENESGEPIREYWGEVAIPKGVVENPSSSAFSWIRERSDGDVDVFRFTQEGRRGKPIYPHDKVEAWSTMFPSDAPRPGQEATVTHKLRRDTRLCPKRFSCEAEFDRGAVDGRALGPRRNVCGHTVPSCYVYPKASNPNGCPSRHQDR